MRPGRPHDGGGRRGEAHELRGGPDVRGVGGGGGGAGGTARAASSAPVREQERAREAPRERRAREGVAPAGEAGDAGRRGEREARCKAGLDAHAVFEKSDAGEARVELGKRVEDAGQRVVVDEHEAAVEGGAPRAVRRLEGLRRGDEEHERGVGVQCVWCVGKRAAQAREGARAPRRAAEGVRLPARAHEHGDGGRRRALRLGAREVVRRAQEARRVGGVRVLVCRLATLAVRPVRQLREARGVAHVEHVEDEAVEHGDVHEEHGDDHVAQRGGARRRHCLQRGARRIKAGRGWRRNVLWCWWQMVAVRCAFSGYECWGGRVACWKRSNNTMYRQLLQIHNGILRFLLAMSL